MGMLTCFNSKLISTCNVSSILYHLASSNSTTIGSIDEILSNYYFKKKTSIHFSSLRRYCCSSCGSGAILTRSSIRKMVMAAWCRAPRKRRKFQQISSYFIRFLYFDHILIISYTVLCIPNLRYVRLHSFLLMLYSITSNLLQPENATATAPTSVANFKDFNLETIGSKTPLEIWHRKTLTSWHHVVNTRYDTTQPLTT